MQSIPDDRPATSSPGPQPALDRELIPADRVAMSPTEVARAFGCSRTLIYEAVKTRKIRAVKLGERVLIPCSELHRIMGATDTTA